MATASFEARLKRIHDAHGDMEIVPQMPLRTRSSPGAMPVMRRRKRRHPLRAPVLATVAGVLSGGIGAVLLLGITSDTSPWGPGTTLYERAYWPAMAALALAPLLILLSVFQAAARPRFALFSLGYLGGLVGPVLM
jgi:hypothetical protein